MEAFCQQRTGERARRMAISQLACMGRHTVTGLLCSSGRQFIDWSGDYRLFSRDRWEANKLFAPILKGVLEFLPENDPFVGAMDDTIARKTGTKIPGVAYRRDPLSPAFHVNFIRGQRFLQFSAMLPTNTVPGLARAIPTRFEHVPPLPKPKKSAAPQEWKAYREHQKISNLSAHGVRILWQIREELDRQFNAYRRQFIVGVDGSYTNKTVIRGLPERTTLIGRIRKDAKLFYCPTPEDQLPLGTKRQYGRPAPTPEELRRDETIAWQEVTAFAAGKLHTFRVKTMTAVLWKSVGAGYPLRLVVIAPVGYRLSKGSKLLYRQPAYLICTDPNLPLSYLIQYYLWRWDIEVNNRDEKQIIGVGEAQVRSPLSVDRQPAFAVASYAALLLSAARAFGTDENRSGLPRPKWQANHHRTRLSTQDLIRQLRTEVWEYGITRLADHSGHFVTPSLSITKAPESQLPVISSLLYAASG